MMTHCFFIAPNSLGQGARKHAGIGHQVQGAFVSHTTGAAFSTSLGCLEGDILDSSKVTLVTGCNMTTTKFQLNTREFNVWLKMIDPSLGRSWLKRKPALEPISGRGTIALLAHWAAVSNGKFSTTTGSLQARKPFGNQIIYNF